MTQTTLVIPTLNRPGDLARCLSSIHRLHRGFDEIIIVDQGDVERTQGIVERHGDLNIQVCHHTIRSAAQARNVGIEKAKGEFIFFVDDDTALDERYVEVAIDYFDRHPGVVGLTGYIDEGRKEQGVLRTLRQAFRKLACSLLLVESFRWKVLRSGAWSAPDYHTTTSWYPGTSWLHDVQWLQGDHFVCRRKVFEAGFRFDERLILRSLSEDIKLSYQVYKHYGRGSLAYLPAFRLCHYASPDQSLTAEADIRMQVLYRFIFWHEEVYNQSPLNALCYLYSQIGMSLLLYRYRSRRHAPLRTIRTLAKSYRYLLANHRGIARGHVDYNRFIIEG